MAERMFVAMASETNKSLSSELFTDFTCYTKDLVFGQNKQSFSAERLRILCQSGSANTITPTFSRVPFQERCFLLIVVVEKRIAGMNRSLCYIN
jgi:hypothetical protein